jgi:hypothetical protein
MAYFPVPVVRAYFEAMEWGSSSDETIKKRDPMSPLPVKGCKIYA